MKRFCLYFFKSRPPEAENHMPFKKNRVKIIFCEDSAIPSAEIWNDVLYIDWCPGSRPIQTSLNNIPEVFPYLARTMVFAATGAVHEKTLHGFWNILENCCRVIISLFGKISQEESKTGRTAGLAKPPCRWVWWLVFSCPAKKIGVMGGKYLVYHGKMRYKRLPWPLSITAACFGR